MGKRENDAGVKRQGERRQVGGRRELDDRKTRGRVQGHTLSVCSMASSFDAVRESSEIRSAWRCMWTSTNTPSVKVSLEGSRLVPRFCERLAQWRGRMAGLLNSRTTGTVLLNTSKAS
jgi:hypothetical protein